jgi:hypothetical protein
MRKIALLLTALASLTIASTVHAGLAEDANAYGKAMAMSAAILISNGESAEALNFSAIELEYERAEELGYTGQQQKRFVEICDASFRDLCRKLANE